MHFAQLPVALWNDHPFDEVGVYTGSATVVGGRVQLLYPGLCKRGSPACPNPTCAGGAPVAAFWSTMPVCLCARARVPAFLFMAAAPRRVTLAEDPCAPH